MPPFVALTGGLGAGKSTALAVLERLGAAVISSDAVVHELYASPEVSGAVAERFGEDVLHDGVVDRAALATRVFAEPREREWLERLLWPLVRRRVTAWREAQSRLVPPPRALVVEVPLLFEAGTERLYDATITITAEESLREARARARGHEAVASREARQLSQAEKAARSTFVVANDGTVLELQAKLSAILDILEARTSTMAGA